MTHACMSLLGHSHPTSCCSAAEIMAVLFFHTMRYKAPGSPEPSTTASPRQEASPQPFTWVCGPCKGQEGTCLPDVSPAFRLTFPHSQAPLHLPHLDPAPSGSVLTLLVSLTKK